MISNRCFMFEDQVCCQCIATKPCSAHIAFNMLGRTENRAELAQAKVTREAFQCL